MHPYACRSASLLTVALSIFLALLAAHAQGGTVQEVWVDDDYHPGSPGWGVTCFSQIQDGLDAVLPGGTVHVKSGYYYDPIVISAPVDLLGENSASSVINGGGFPVTLVTVLPGASGSTIMGLTLKYSGIVSPYAALRADRADGLTVQNNLFEGNYCGIHLLNSIGDTIFHNEFINNDLGVRIEATGRDIEDISLSLNSFDAQKNQGIHLNILEPFKSKNISIVQNIIKNTDAHGVYGYGLDNCQIRENTFSGNNIAGIYLHHFCLHNSIDKNVFQKGKYTPQYSIYLHGSSNWNEIIQNTANDGRYFCKLWDECTSNLMIRNTVRNGQGDGGFAVSMNCNYNSILKNVIEGRLGPAITLDESCCFNTVESNFLKNNFQGLNIQKFSESNAIIENVISGCSGDGIALNRSDSNVIEQNIIASNEGHGIYMNPDYPSFFTTIRLNSFLSNTAGHAFDQGDNTWNGSTPGGGNYWDNYSGTDLNGDGFGDRPYPIGGGACVDYYPLMAPPGGGALWTSRVLLSAGYGGMTTFSLHSGNTRAGRIYLLLGSQSGTSPGTLLPGGAVLPLKWDAFSNFVLERINTQLFSNFMAPLDGTGSGSTFLTAAPGSIPASWAGKTLHFAYLLDFPFNSVSNPARIEIIP